MGDEAELLLRILVMADPRDARRIFHWRCWMPYNLFFARRSVGRSLYNWRYSLFTPLGRWELGSEWRVALNVRTVDVTEVSSSRYHHAGRRSDELLWPTHFLAASAAAAADWLLCSHALERRLSSAQTRARQSPQPPAGRCSHALAARSWRQHQHLSLDRKSFTLHTWTVRPSSRRLPAAFLHINAPCCDYEQSGCMWCQLNWKFVFASPHDWAG